MIDQLIDGWRRPGVKWLVAFTVALVVFAYFGARAESATSQVFAPIDIAALIQAITALVAGLGTVYALIAASRAKRAEASAVIAAAAALATSVKTTALGVQIDGLLVARDKAKENEGAAKEKLAGEETARTLAEGQRQGREMGASGQAPVSVSVPKEAAALVQGKKPVEVSDDRTAKAAERSADAQERTADATEKKVDEQKKEP